MFKDYWLVFLQREISVKTRVDNLTADHRRQRRRGCRGRIPGNIWSVGDEMSYNPPPPKFDKIVTKLPAEPMRTVQPSFAVQARQRDSQRERVIVLILHEL